MKKYARVAVLVPCWNEESTVAKVVKDFKRALPGANIFVYDNNSTDNTAAKAKQAGAIVRRELQQGKGNVVRRMFLEVDADAYIMVDGDDTYPAGAARGMVDAVLKEGVDMVVGDRLSSSYVKNNKRRFHGFGNNFVRRLINHLFKSDIRDVMTGYRAFSYRFVKTFPVLSSGFEIETEMTIHAVDKNMQIKNVVVDYRDRPAGSKSKLDTIPDGVRVLRTIVQLFRDYKPFRFWGVIAAVLYAISIAFVIPVFIDYANTGIVERFPTLIVCGFAFITATLSLFAGVILQAILRNNRREFEFKLHLIEQRKK